MNLLCFLGAVGLSVASGSATLPDYSIVDRSASDVPTFRDEVFTRPLLDYYPQTGVNGISPFHQYCDGFSNAGGESWLSFGVRYSPRLCPWTFDFGVILDFAADTLTGQDFSSPGDIYKYFRIILSNDFFYDYKGNAVQPFGLGWYSNSSIGYSLDYVFNQYGSFYTGIMQGLSGVPIGASSTSGIEDVIPNHNNVFGYESYLLCDLGMDLSAIQDARAIDDFMHPNASFTAAAFAQQYRVSTYRSDFDAAYRNIITGFRPLINDLYLWGEYDGQSQSSAFWQQGYDQGLRDGYEQGAQGTAVEVVNFYDVFAMIVTTPISFLTTALDTELYTGTPYAFNPSVFVLSLLSILMIWRIVVMVIGLKGD